MWFYFALATVLLWGGADLFYKKGTVKNDKYSPLKIVVAVGFVMGIHAAIYLIINKDVVNILDIVKYLPVSLLYITSMFVGYWGLRYLDLSVSSPVQNASGALVAILCVIFFDQVLSVLDILGIIIICIGVILIGVFEKKDEEIVLLRSKDKKHSISFVAIMFPIGYCILDSLGTFADAIYLDELSLITESSALISYELTFFITAVVCFFFLFMKKQKISIKDDKFKLFAACFETGGQFFYVYAMGEMAVIAAPMVASYCIVSIILSRIFLKEKPSLKMYMTIAAVVLGIVLLGISEGLAG